jgi:branched-chain amino acid transport system permease protein
MEGLAQDILNGLLLGGLYAVVAIGLSTIFGIVKLVNLAHGDLMILASYLSLFIAVALGISPLLTMVAIIPIMFFIGYILQRFLLNRVLGEEMEPPLLVAFGVSIILQNFMLMAFTPDARSLMSSLSLMTFSIGDSLNVPVLYLIDFCIALAVIAALHYFLQGTYMGKGIRAASDDKYAAQLMGVNTKNTYAVAMGIAIMTAGVAGVLVGMTFTFYPHSGPQYLIIAFGVVVIGGLGSMKGTFIGGLVLALAQILGARAFGPGYQLLCGYVVLLIVLALRPQGILGRS